VRDEAVAVARILATRAVSDCPVDAELIPARFAAERICSAHGGTAVGALTERGFARRVATSRIRIAAARAVLRSAFGAELIPFVGAAERVFGAHRCTARRIVAVRSLVGCVATGGIARILTAGATLDCRCCARGIPLRRAAEGIEVAHNLAARRVIAVRSGMRCVATGCVGGILAARALFNGSIHAELIPIGVAAERVCCTDGVAARLVGAVRVWA
jgi:hypothetical protein